MADQLIGKYTRGFGLSLAIMIIFNVLLVLFKETNTTLMNWMKAVSPHHWITHGFLVLALFIILGLVFSNLKFAEKSRVDAPKISRWLIAATVIGGGLIVSFYLVDLMK